MATYHWICHIVGMLILIYVGGRTIGTDLATMVNHNIKVNPANMMMMYIYLAVAAILIFGGRL